MIRRKVNTSVVLLAVLLVGCATFPRNPPLDTYDPSGGYRYRETSPTENSESLFVILSFSGGGTRAAALAYGVLEELRDTIIVWEGRERRLLDEVDVISSISGGSFTAAYYGLFGDQTFERFGDAFLYRNVQGELVSLLWSPANWFRLLSPTYGRIDMAADFYDREIFEEKSFGDLSAERLSPYIMVNATDMSMGAPFSFTQDQFDLLCSDVGGVKVARAVAASSNFPVAFTPLAIVNYAGQCGYKEPGWVEQGLKDVRRNPGRYNRARLLRSYQSSRQRPYIHLLDGGVADNIGLRGPLVALRSNDASWSIPNKINNGVIQKLVVITVDAKTAPPVDFDQSPSPPGTLDVLKTISTVPLDNYSFETVELLRMSFQRWQADRQMYAGCKAVLETECPGREMPSPPPPPVDLYWAYVGFERIDDPDRKRYFQTMDTSFRLPRKQIDDLRTIGRTLLEESKDYRRLIASLR